MYYFCGQYEMVKNPSEGKYNKCIKAKKYFLRNTSFFCLPASKSFLNQY
jgi:hypothetical protein